MRVNELKQIVPVVDVYELKPGVRYLVRIPEHMERATITLLAEQLNRANIAAVLFDGSVTFYEINESLTPCPAS